MTNFWWVNHKQTVRQEIDGQYLWSPKTNNNGSRNEFYNNMRRASRGDLVLSYANQVVGYVGRVTEFAFTAPKPSEFGSVGDYWNNEGWLLPVFWTRLEQPVRPMELIDRLRPLLPNTHSPINHNSGGGNQNAYLAAISKAVFDTVVNSTHFDRNHLEFGGTNSLTYDAITEVLDDAIERNLAANLQFEDTVKKSVIEARRGQGKFRKNVESIEKSCRLTGITNPSFLIAGHIKPWRVCKTPQERLDGMNGLLLTPDADLLFDRGYISFEDNGEVLVSPRVDHTDLQRLGFDQLVRQRFGLREAPANWRTGAFLAQQCGYLAFHRSDVFIE